jgi:starch phosphorylase
MRISRNLWWAWHHEARELFAELDREVWDQCQHNPVQFLSSLNQDRLDAAANNQAYLDRLERVTQDLRRYMQGGSTWYSRSERGQDEPLVAYFSAEFGVTECLSIFAGGLGVLAGDHLKSASDLGLPLIGVGLLYQQGYFHQFLNEAGWQQETYLENDFQRLPLELVRDEAGQPICVGVDFPGRQVFACIWKVQVGRVPLFLLDTNLPLNEPNDRGITDKLYGGDIETRIQQEIVLGIGGYRALRAMGLSPTIYHMNEGHSAFLSLERVREIMERHGVTFAEAKEAASAGLVYTSHTPVPAGHDYFSPDLIDQYFHDYVATLGISLHDFLAMGRQNPANDAESFCMTILALRLASYCNGVSDLHGEVTRMMWRGIWPGVPANEIPIGSVTNGVHLSSWIAPEMTNLYDTYIGDEWRHEPANHDVWRRIDNAPAEAIWKTHEECRRRLVDFARARLTVQYERRGASRLQIDSAAKVLRPDALTIGFGRRFAAYKRATLLFRDPARLARLLTDPERPVQIIIAGKAHPRDDQGKELIRQIVSLAREAPFRDHIVFIEDYDIYVASQMVQGADVWLNTPRRPMEASGTSGMKAAANGVLNMSTIDGWWAEAWKNADPDRPPIGWPIGRSEPFASLEIQDQADSQDLYEILEKQVIPTFYRRGDDGLPHDWIAQMRSSISQLTGVFNTHRMVWQYYQHFYLPSSKRFNHLTRDGLAASRDLACWKQTAREHWGELRVTQVETDAVESVPTGTSLDVVSHIQTGSLSPDDVNVQIYVGPTDGDGEILSGSPIPMSVFQHDGEGNAVFGGTIDVDRATGPKGFTVRILPRHPDLVTPFLPGLITWA